LIKSVDLPEIELEVACGVIDSVEFGKIYGFYDVRSTFELDRLIVWSCGFWLLFVSFWALSDGYPDKNESSTPLWKNPPKVEDFVLSYSFPGLTSKTLAELFQCNVLSYRVCLFVAAQLLCENYHNRKSEKNCDLFEAADWREWGNHLRLQIPQRRRENSVFVRCPTVSWNSQLKPFLFTRSLSWRWLVELFYNVTVFSFFFSFTHNRPIVSRKWCSHSTHTLSTYEHLLVSNLTDLIAKVCDLLQPFSGLSNVAVLTIAFCRRLQWVISDVLQSIGKLQMTYAEPWLAPLLYAES